MNRQYQKEYRIKNKKRLEKYYSEWREKNPDYGKEQRLRRNYGLNIDALNETLVLQHGCAICGTWEPGRWWSVDHDHSCCPTEKTCGECLRGVLCESCNISLGRMRDDPELFEQAADYLRSHRESAVC